MGKSGLDGEEHGLEVEIGGEVKVLLACLPQRREVDTTCVRYENVDLAEPLGGRIEQTLEIGPVGDVEVSPL